jgi:hypothetical protein
MPKLGTPSEPGAMIEQASFSFQAVVNLPTVSHTPTALMGTFALVIAAYINSQ